MKGLLKVRSQNLQQTFSATQVMVLYYRLTAEDVRKQHPRILANELETLRLENSRLHSQVQVLEKDKKKLVMQEV